MSFKVTEVEAVEGCQVERSYPVNVIEQEKYLFENTKILDLPAVNIRVLDNAQLLDHIPFDFARLEFHPQLTHIFPVSGRRLLKRFRLLLRSRIELQQAIWITDEWSGEYFHWLTDALPRYLIALDYCKNSPILLPQHVLKKQFIVDSLEHLNATYVAYDARHPYTIKQLIVPQHTAPTGNYHPLIIRELAEKLRRSTGVTASRKVYVSRKKAGKRFIQNEEEVTATLASFGYETHCFEDYSLADQIELLGETRVLIGVHGAGLTNMLFMPPNSIVCEIRNQGDAHNNCFFSLANALQHSYFYLTAAGTSPHTYDANLWVDVSRLKEQLLLIEKMV